MSSSPTLTTTKSPIAGELTGEMGVCYKECLKNHAANLGRHALDGCGEFMPSPNANPTDPSSLRCAACGCHRNFHRREPSDISHLNFLTSSPSGTESPPSPVPCFYYTSPPHQLFLSSTSGFPGPSDRDPTGADNSSQTTKKRTRTKFTAEQKIKMRAFAEKAGWRINGCDEKSVRDFCNEVGMERGVLKVWMNNNKYSFINVKNKEISSTGVCLNTHSCNNVDGSSSS